jgi:hypothetical protein
MTEVTHLDVYGFNGMGDENAHIDFANKTIIKNCCTKCKLHKTASDSYGNEAAFATFATLLGVLVVFAVLTIVCARRIIRQMLKVPERRPLLALPVEQAANP